MAGKYTREDCLRLLRDKSRELSERGEDRLPRRSDFEDGAVVAVKSFLGPWPRALEEAGLKEPRAGDRQEKNREKRRRARRRARNARRAARESEEKTDV